MIQKKYLYSLIILFFLAISTNDIIAQNELYPKAPAIKTPDPQHWDSKRIYTVPEGGRKWYRRGLMSEYDGVIDVRHFYGFRIDVLLNSDQPFEGTFTIARPANEGRQDLLDAASAHITLQGKGWHTLTIPFSAFNYNRGQEYLLKIIKTFQFSGKYLHRPEKKEDIAIKNFQLIRGNPVYFDAPVYSKPGTPGTPVQYNVTIGNSANIKQNINLSFIKTGWEGMTASVSPEFVSLMPGEEKNLTVTVHLSGIIPEGAQEKQILQATSSQGISEKVEFITLHTVHPPYLIHREEGWEKVRQNIHKYDWAAEQFNNYKHTADTYDVNAGRGGADASYIYRTGTEHKFRTLGIAYKLTGEKKYAQTMNEVFRIISDEFPAKLKANSADIPQEGYFWETIALCYDLIRDSGVMSDADKRDIEYAMRLYVYTIIDGLGNGGISNWSTYNQAPAAQCALVIQDMHLFNQLMYGSCGLVDHLRYALMDDGWWYEMSLAYNLGVAEYYTRLGIAARTFGIDLLNEKYPVALTKDVGLRPFEYESFLGMAFGKYGPVKKNTVSVKQMWDGIIIYPDFRTCMFGMGDGHEEMVSGSRFEAAFLAYGDVNYASIIKQAKERDLIYGITELPDKTPELHTQSGYSPNAGIAILRSQTEDRPDNEQIQAVMKYGTHGSYHGHFDRISLLALSRYGRSFYNPETSWFGYGSYMYKWWVQPSVSHNMVVVDGKQQEPQECTQLLFYPGKMMQVVAAETIARWSNPPYFGGYEQIEDVRKGKTNFVPIPENHPMPGDVTDYTEPIKQRRLMVVTDDYVLIADKLEAEKEHTFHHLMHLRGVMTGKIGNIKYTDHSNQWDPNPLSSGQFITDVNHYNIQAPTVIPSIFKIAGKDPVNSNEEWKYYETGGARSLSVPGTLNIDEHILWPKKARLSIGNYAESRSGSKTIDYSIYGDGKKLGSGIFKAWLLGDGDINIDVSGVRKIMFEIKSERWRNNPKTIFLGGLKLLNSKGKEIHIPQSIISCKNVSPVQSQNNDYEGGPVRLNGITYATSIPAEPEDYNQPSVIEIDLSGLDAMRLEVALGGDWPVGNEEQLRKTVAVQTQGKEATFVTLIEPYEGESMIKSAMATSPSDIKVELVDGRTQHISLTNFDNSDPNPQVYIRETLKGKEIRTETTH